MVFLLCAGRGQTSTFEGPRNTVTIFNTSPTLGPQSKTAHFLCQRCRRLVEETQF